MTLRRCWWIAPLGPWAVAPAPAGTPGQALNFHDVTATRVVETVAEQTFNKKDLDVGDFDNDGDLDVVIAVAFSDFGTRRNKLYRNDGGVLTEISGAPAIPGFSGLDTSRAVFMRDYDADGWLDIYVVNGANSGPGAGTDRVYVNVQDGGAFSTFVDETALRLPVMSVSGCSAPGCTGASDGGVSFDADGDGDADVYIGNEANSSQDRLLLNDGAGFFTDVTATHVPVDFDQVDHVSVADVNGDARLDVLVANGAI